MSQGLLQLDNTFLRDAHRHVQLEEGKKKSEEKVGKKESEFAGKPRPLAHHAPL